MPGFGMTASSIIGFSSNAGWARSLIGRLPTSTVRVQFFGSIFSIQKYEIQRIQAARNSQLPLSARELGQPGCSSKSDADEATQAGASIHIWLSFAEYVSWNKQGTEATFAFNGFHENTFIDALCTLVRESCVPVFVSFCTASEFHHGGEIQMERTLEKSH